MLAKDVKNVNASDKDEALLICAQKGKLPNYISLNLHLVQLAIKFFRIQKYRQITDH